MAIFTNITLEEANDLLDNYALDDMTSITPIQAGTVNSNFYLTQKDNTRYILTIFETLSAQHVDAILKITDAFAEQGLPTPKPYPTKLGDFLTTCKQKPAAIVACLPGQTKSYVTPNDCNAIATFMAKMHTSAQQKTFMPIENTMGTIWRKKVYNALKAEGKLDKQILSLCHSIFHQLDTLPLDALPQGFIHADLFKDNVLFENDILTGVIDFYFGCDGHFLYDFAILANDWCFRDHKFIEENYQALVSAYTIVRPFSDLEKENWQPMLLLACLRFWLSRLDTLHFPRNAITTTPKDPKDFEILMDFHLSYPLAI